MRDPVEVRVNGRPAVVGEELSHGATVVTGAESEAVLVVGENALLLGAHTRLSVRHEIVDHTPRTRLELAHGRLLAAFGPGSVRLMTPAAVIAAADAGLWLEAGATETVVCTCFGATRLRVRSRADVWEEIHAGEYGVTRRVDARLGREAIVDIPPIRHSQDDLVRLESMMGRRLPYLTLGAFHPYAH